MLVNLSECRDLMLFRVKYHLHGSLGLVDKKSFLPVSTLVFINKTLDGCRSGATLLLASISMPCLSLCRFISRTLRSRFMVNRYFICGDYLMILVYHILKLTKSLIN